MCILTSAISWLEEVSAQAQLARSLRKIEYGLLVGGMTPHNIKYMVMGRRLREGLVCSIGLSYNLSGYDGEAAGLTGMRP